MWVIITKKFKGSADSESQLIQQLQNAITHSKDGFQARYLILIIAGLIAILLVGTLVYLTIFGRPGGAPEYLIALVTTIVGFYFGGVLTDKHKEDKN